MASFVRWLSLAAALGAVSCLVGIDEVEDKPGTGGNGGSGAAGTGGDAATGGTAVGGSGGAAGSAAGGVAGDASLGGSSGDASLGGSAGATAGGGTGGGGTGAVGGAGGTAAGGGSGGSGGTAGTGGTGATDGGACAAAEVCGDGLDNDCLGGADNGCGGLGTFVSALTGSDTNPGTKAAPVKTITKGMQNGSIIRGKIGANVDVFIAQGTYPEAVNMVEGVSLVGGYSCGSVASCTWEKHPTPFSSIVEPPSFEGTLAGHTITRATRIEALYLRGKSGAPPAGSFGASALTIDGSPTVTGCRIDAPNATGSWPAGRSFGVFIASSADTAGPLVVANRISGNVLTVGPLTDWSVGLGMSNRPGQAKPVYAEVRQNDIFAGNGGDWVVGVELFRSLPGTVIADNDIQAGVASGGKTFALVSNSAAAIDRNRVNVPGGAPISCTSSDWCGGVLCDGCSGTFTNNVIYGAFSGVAQSVALALGEFEAPAGSVAVHSNYLHAGGQATGKSAAVVLETAACTTCGFKGKIGRLRGNILDPGGSTNRCAVFEDPPGGKQIHPEAFESNWFVVGGSSTCLYSFVDASSSTQTTTAAATTSMLVSAGIPAQSNLEGDPLIDTTYHLKTGSPCIDKSTSSEAPAKDMDGDTRPKGGGYDIGPDEAG